MSTAERDPDSILSVLADNPIIAACRPESIHDAVASRASIVLLMNAPLTWLIRPDFQELRSAKPVLVHADLIKGLSGERESIRFLRDFVGPAGIVSTRSTTIRAARKEGVPVIQRVFLIDSASLRTSTESIRENRPTAVEIMPGIATAALAEIREAVGIPVIAAGLVRSRAQVLAALTAGADAVSMSSPELWNQEYPSRRS